MVADGMQHGVYYMKILIVEDERKTGDYLKQGLGEAGFVTDLVRDGIEGAHRTLAEDYDLVVLDVMLPDINGKEVCQRVRKDHPQEEVKIICISGMVEEDKIADLKTAGANDFLHKPFEVDVLIDRMCRLLDIETASTR